LRAPHLSLQLREQIVRFVQKLRAADLFKLPGVAETIDFAQAILALDQVALSPETVDATLGVLLKYQDDIEKIAGARVQTLLEESPGV